MRKSTGLMLLLALSALAYGLQRTTSKPGSSSPFNEQRAGVDMQTIVGFGPRPAGSDAIVTTRNYIVSELEKAGLKPQLDEFDARTPRGFRHMVNIRATRAGAKPSLIAITGHYDTKFFDNLRFVGASDGGSSAAWLLEFARSTAGLKLQNTLEFVFFDGEEAVVEWTDDDSVVWEVMMRERDAGRARLLGVSNVSLSQLEQMVMTGAEPPTFVQNRCFARFGWDRGVRQFCADRGIVYQGFSLLTANRDVLRHPFVAGLADRDRVTPAQVIFRFALTIGMLPLTGTSDPEHMTQDLASRDLVLSPDEIQTIESIAG